MRACLFTLALLALPLSGQAEMLSGRVVAIVDGDTLVLQVARQRHTIRIAGIDAPERVQSFGARSQANLGQMVFQQQAEADCTGRDGAGQSRCKVWIEGQDVGLRQLADGMAWWLREAVDAPTSEQAMAYQQAEMMARLRRLGLWSETNPTPPWNWGKLTR